MQDGGLRPGRHLLQARTGDEIVLLDLSRGEYILLDPVATAMWEALRSTAGVQEAAARLTTEFEDPDGTLMPDILQFRERCIALGLVDRGTRSLPPPKPARTSRFPLLAALRCLHRTARQLRREGFAHTYGRIMACAPAPHGRPEPGSIALAEAAFSRAENLFLARSAPDDCLPRSLALYAFLRTMGHPAEHRFGFLRYPFAAHAWVECAGRVILDEDRRDRLTPLLPVS
ncbi:MAG: lasso peptide biosynthesis B2 protein [Allosphingosinicella sp.]